MGAEPADGGQQNARYGKCHTQRLRDRSRLGGWPHGHYRREARAKALGIEYNPDMVELSKRNAAKEGVSDKATFMKADLFESDFSQATVISMFLLPDINLKLRPKILDLKPGTRIVSNTFTMAEWQADETATVNEDCISYCLALFWIVPAKVGGTWQLPQGELALKQTFQMISGTLKSGNVHAHHQRQAARRSDHFLAAWRPIHRPRER